MEFEGWGKVVLVKYNALRDEFRTDGRNHRKQRGYRYIGVGYQKKIK